MLNRTCNEWRTVEHMLKAMVLSVREAGKYGPVVLHTDSFGQQLALLLGLQAEVLTTFEDTDNDYPEELFAVGKVQAYSCHSAPFMHVDLDAFLFDLPQRLLDAQVGCFCPESTLRSGAYGMVYDYARYGLRPVYSWTTDLAEAANMGIYVCRDSTLNEEYCHQVSSFLSLNREALRVLPRDKLRLLNMSLEQYTLAALAKQFGHAIEYCQGSPSVDWKSGVVHLMGRHKYRIENCSMLDKLCDVDVSDAQVAWEFEVTRGR